MTEKTVTKTTEKKVKAPVIQVDEKGAVKPEAKSRVPSAVKATVPAEVLALAKELKVDADSLLGWNVYPDRVVLISMNGMKFSKHLNQGK